jgi:protein-S-isoprenylcysteine O-methyltransferase Ste14
LLSLTEGLYELGLSGHLPYQSPYSFFMTGTLVVSSTCGQHDHDCIANELGEGDFPAEYCALLPDPELLVRDSPVTDGSMSRMHAVELVFAIGWAAFWIYWLVAAFAMKRGHVPWSRELRIRAVVVVGAILLIRSGAFRDDGLNSDPWRAGLGLFLFALRPGFAIWARLHIGRNGGTPMSQKDEPELVTSGPYHLVRHPIYSGILVAGAGTAVALSWMWLVAMVLAGVYFVYSATVEERYLTKQFPGSRAEVEVALRAGCSPDVDALMQDLMTSNPTVRWAITNGMYVMGVDSPRAFAAAYLDYTLAGGIAEQITCPTLVCDGESDMFSTGQPQELFDHLNCPKTLLRFTDAEGAPGSITSPR